MIDPVRPIELSDVERAQRNVEGTVLRTPLVKMELGGGAPEIWLKLGISSRPMPTRSAARPMLSLS